MRAFATCRRIPPPSRLATVRLSASQTHGRWGDGIIRASHYSRGLQLIAKAVSAFRIDGWTPRQIDPDVVRYIAGLSIWGRWFVVLVTVVQFVYRPGFWYFGHFEYTLLLVPLIALNGLVHIRLLAKGWVPWLWLLVLSAMDIALATAGVVIQGGFSGFIFVAYYPALALFALVFTSVWLGLAWTTMVAGVYSLVCLTVDQGLDFVAGHEKELIVRVAAMYAVILYVSLIANFERTRRQAAVARERALQRERLEFSQAIHDTTAQSAYMIGLGIDAAKQVAGSNNAELTARLDATAVLSKTAIWQLRHPIDMGRLFEGRELGRTLDSHLTTFTSITSVPAKLTQSGTEPPLPIEVKRMLFAIAHNALTNAFRHAHASRVLLTLEFGEDDLRLTVADDGRGLPADYADRGHGFANMRADAERLGGRLLVEPRGPLGGASVTCVMPLGRREQEN